MSISKSLFLLIPFAVMAVVGCGAADQNYAPTAPLPMSEEVADTNATLDAAPTGDMNLVAFQPQAAPGATDPAPAANPTAPAAARKVIHTATLDIEVEQFDGIPARIDELATRHGGFISKANVDTAKGRSRHGTWTIRVPVERYRPFMNAAGTIGVLQRGLEDSREVTAEYYDLDSRLRNKEREESRLLEHLDQLGDNLQQVLVVEKELSRVRQEVEQIAGQLRLLRDVTGLSTVTINVSEVEEYMPPQSPTFVARIESTWSSSLGSLSTLGQFFTLVVVALAPWVLTAAVPVLLATVAIRRHLRTRPTA